jgi:HEAT repeat protein
MKTRLLWFLALSGLVAMGASGCDEDVPSSGASVSAVPTEHRAAWADVETIKLVLDESYEKDGEPWEASIRPAMADLIQAAGLTVTEQGEADAELSITVSGEQSPALPPEGPMSHFSRRWFGAEHMAKVEANMVLTVSDLDAVSATSDEARYFESETPETPVIMLAKDRAARAFLTLLARLDPDVYCSFLESDDHFVRRSAFGAAADFGGPPEAILVEVLTNRGEAVEMRSCAAAALTNVMPISEVALSALLIVLGDTDDEAEVRAGAATALGHARDAPDAVLPALADALSDDEELVRASAALALAWGDVEPSADATLDALVEVLDDDEPVVRCFAAGALGRIGPSAEAAVPQLAEALEDDQEFVRAAAAQALGEIGPASEPAIPALIEMLSECDRDTRVTAANALGRIGRKPDDVVPALLKVLNDEEEDGTVKTFAGQSLDEMAPAAVPLLIDALKSGSPTARRWAARALGEAGPAAEAAIPVLFEGMKDEDPRVRAAAIRALMDIGVPPNDVVPHLVEALNDGSPYVREDAAWALGQIGPEAKAAVPALEGLLTDEDEGVRKSAQSALARIAGD